jgi:DNA-directed RNA polymerase subunit RPC12/RpoP
MRDHLLYICPHCETSCSVALDQVGFNVVCPSCGQEVTATPPDLASHFQPPANVPFFKSGKLEIPKNRLNKLTSDEELSESDEIALTRAALILFKGLLPIKILKTAILINDIII